MTDREVTRVRDAIDGVLAAARGGDENITLDRLERLIRMSEDSIHSAVWELASADVQMLRTLTGPEMSDDGRPVKFELRDTGGQAVSVDELDPPLRSAVRTVLALAHGRDDDAHRQLDIVDQLGEPADTGAVLVQMLAWTLELLGGCEQADRPAPHWLRPVLSTDD
ncbi:MAG TPA: hypothetical protein VG317_15740 [Pseudonocardiaceae bacterium]|nr:hypothetical protein [Pseudonocardiaceae bacterium]